MITLSYQASNDVCPKCKGSGFVLRWHDDRLLHPDVWKVKDINEVKRDKTIRRLNGKMYDSEGRELLTSTSKFIAAGRPEFAVEYAEPCPNCKGVSRYTEDSRDSNIPNEFRTFNYSSFDWSRYKTDTTNKQKIIEHYINNFQEMREQTIGLYISSKTKGSGKTYLACAIANSLMLKDKVNVKFITMLDYLKKIELNRQYGNHDYTDPYYQVELLIIDDFSQAKNSETINKAFYSLIDYRQKHYKPIIFTSNDNVQQLKYDERIISRISSKSLAVVMPEEDIRNSIAAGKLNKIMRDAGVQIGGE